MTWPLPEPSGERPEGSEGNDRSARPFDEQVPLGDKRSNDCAGDSAPGASEEDLAS